MGYMLTELYLAAFLHINANEASLSNRNQGGGGRWGQIALRAALWSNFGHYRADRIIPYCRDLKKYSAAATVYEMLHYWSEALSCHLDAFAVFYEEAQTDDIVTSLEALAPMLSSLMKACIEGKVIVNVEPMQQVLLFWKDHDLPVQILEEWFIEHVALLGPILGVLAAVHDADNTKEDTFRDGMNQGGWGEGADDLHSDRATELKEIMEEVGMGQSDDHANNGQATSGLTEPQQTHSQLAQQWHFSPWVHKFSSALHLAVAEAELASLDKDHQEEVARHEKGEIWQEIHGIMEARLGNMDHHRIVLSVGQTDNEVATMLSGPGMPGWRSSSAAEEEETIAFTCGHCFGRGHYLSSIVPEFKSRPLFALSLN